MAEVIDYLSRPAPSRIMPWPGNPVREMCINSMAMKHMGANNGREGKKLKAGYKGKEYSFDSIREAAEYMCLGVKTLGKNINQKKVPQTDGIEWIEVDGQRFYKTKVEYNHRRIKVILKGETIIFEKVVDAMDFFRVTRMTIHSWIRGGCLRDNGVSYIGYYE